MALQSNKKKAGQFKITIWILYCVIFFFICSFKNLYSQVIIGTVHDCGNKKPIENANLHIKGTSIGITSNKFGFFEMNYNYNNIENQLIISHIAYKEKIIELNENQIQDTLIICLESKSINLK